MEMFKSSSKKMHFISLVLSIGSLRAYLILSIIISLVAASSQQLEAKLVDNSILQNIQDDTQLQNSSTSSEGSFNTTAANSVASSPLRNLDINSVIKLFESALKNSSINSSDDTINQLQNEQLKQPQQAQFKKLIRSRYRSRVINPTESLKFNGLHSNYSQPFDTPPIEQQHQQLASGRALSSVPVSTNHGTVVSESPTAYSYLAAHSQRAPVHSAALPMATSVSNNVNIATASGFNGESNSAGLVLDDPTSYNQENLLDYTPPLQQTSNNPGYTQSVPYNRMYSSSSRSRGSPYFMASPSSSYSDYYGGGNGDHLSSSSDYATDHYVPRSMLSGSNSNNNYSDHHINYEQSTPSFSGSMPFPFGPADISHSYGPSSNSLGMGRSRWSWPWTDVSSFGSGFGNVLASNPMTSATFKKHYHHHHMPAHHKEHEHHHHHEEHDHLSKFEHGITIGEIACIAIAVILGVIILGSPFFLLFLMLFNGGNIFGGTQMGLLAPAVASGGGGGGGSGGGASGRRRRKRSVDNISNKVGVGLSKKELEARLKELDLHGVSEYLFDRLSPFMDADKLMRSFEKIMEVKDDIESLVTKIGLGDAKYGMPFKDSHDPEVEMPTLTSAEESKYKHVEMRRRKKK